MFTRWCRAREETLRAPRDAKQADDAAASESVENLRLDYQTTRQQFTTLADIRFKLLAFVPTVTGAAFGILKDSKNNAATAAIGVFGFLVTLGIIFYEIRNTQFYDCAAHRAKALEACLKFPICAAGFTVGGLFSERSKDKLRLFGVVQIWHDRGLAIVYGSTLAAWSLLVFHAILAAQPVQRHFTVTAGQRYTMSAVVAGAIGFVFGWQMIRLSQMHKPAPAPPVDHRIDPKSRTQTAQPVTSQVHADRKSRPKTENIRTVYNQLCESYRAIDDFRLKLLAALPLASGTGIFLLIGKADEKIQSGFLLPIGLFGFVASLGLFIFEIYGIRKCTHLIVLGTFLEKELGIEGQFKHRPCGVEHFRFIPAGIAPLISEPFASGIIYPAVLGAWTFVASYNAGAAVAGILATMVFAAGFLVALNFNRWLGKEDAPNKESELEDLATLEDLTRCMGEAEKNRNDKFFEALLARDLTFRRANGAIVDTETFLAGLRNPANTYETLEPSDIAVQRYEGLGVVTLLVQTRRTREGKPYDDVFRNVRIFLQEPDNDPPWQLHSWFNVRVS